MKTGQYKQPDSDYRLLMNQGQSVKYAYGSSNQLGCFPWQLMSPCPFSALALVPDPKNQEFEVEMLLWSALISEDCRSLRTVQTSPK